MGIQHSEKNILINKILNGDGEVIDKIKVKPGELPIKEFAARNSLLTDLLEIKHIRTIYHIFIAILIGLFLNIALNDCLQNGKSQLGLSLVIKGFSHIHVLLFLWSFLFFSTLLVYIGFTLWAINRIKLGPKSNNLKIWDQLCLTVFLMYYPNLFYFAAKSVTKYDLSIAEGLAVLMETTRILMKMHAFVRSNAPRVLKYKAHTEDQMLYPKFSQFLYFSFAPTLVYRDSYPRSTHIRWKYVIQCFLEVLGVIFFLSVVLQKCHVNVLENYGIEPFTWQNIVIIIFGNAASGILIKLAMFYLILHAWPNAFAEMLRFSDRTFYKDWWTSTTYERYYRTWNVTIHDWLYTYVYKDLYEIVLPKNKLVAKIMVFFVSAVFHELILGFAFRFFFPILFVQFFGVGVLVTFFKIKNNLIGNVFVWYSLALGMGMNSTTLALEHYARVNCPVENETLIDYFIPRLFSCYKY